MIYDPNSICLPTLAAVNKLSPVIIITLYAAYFNALILVNVSSFKGELQTKNPAKVS